jgi:hypothetical protein
MARIPGADHCAPALLSKVELLDPQNGKVYQRLNYEPGILEGQTGR